jgi:hypothetical protein
VEEQEAAGAAAKKGIRGFGNRGAIENEVDVACFRTGIQQRVEGELIALELPGRSGKATGGHEEPQEGVVHWW